jgi:hypothetical protein
MGALIDKIAASGSFSSYTRPVQADQPTETLRVAHALALDLAEDFRDLGLTIGVTWEGNWVTLNWPGGSDFSFVAIDPGAFRLDRTRKRAVVSRDKLISEIAKWVEIVQRELL